MTEEQTAITNLETRPATAEEIKLFERDNGVGYRYVRSFHGRCPNCGEEYVKPRGFEGLHDALDGSGYSCEGTLPAQWPMTAGSVS